MDNALSQVQAAINANDVEQARNLLRKILANNPTADAWYLASLVAANSNQRMDFLKKSLALDPTQEAAREALEGTQPQQDTKKFPPSAPQPLPPPSLNIPEPALPDLSSIYNKASEKPAKSSSQKAISGWMWAIAGFAVGSVIGIIFGLTLNSNRSQSSNSVPVLSTDAAILVAKDWISAVQMAANDGGKISVRDYCSVSGVADEIHHTSLLSTLDMINFSQMTQSGVVGGVVTPLILDLSQLKYSAVSLSNGAWLPDSRLRRKKRDGREVENRDGIDFKGIPPS